MSNLSRTNIDAIQAFEEDLLMYEASVLTISNSIADYLRPAQIMKGALDKIFSAQHSDAYSMMRILVDRVSKGIDGSYSDGTLSMLAASMRDDHTRKIIFSVTYVIREMIVGNIVELNDVWLMNINNNSAIYTFLKNYTRSDQKMIEETYSGNVIRPAYTIEDLESNEDDYTLVVGYANYRLQLTNETTQTLLFAVSPLIKPGPDAKPNEKLTIATSVIITTNTGDLNFDASIGFFDDALAQMSALGCAPIGYVNGEDTSIVLPDKYHRLAITIASSDSGWSWRVSEVNILPPDISVGMMS